MDVLVVHQQELLGHMKGSSSMSNAAFNSVDAICAFKQDRGKAPILHCSGELSNLAR